MSRFDRYILSTLLGVFGFFALVLVGVYWINRAVGLFDQLISDGQTALVFLAFSALTLPFVIKLVLPVAAFIAAVYGGNRLIADSELVVMQATGFSPFRLARPVALFGLVVTGMMLVLTLELVPLARITADQQRARMSENITARFLDAGQFSHPAPGVTLYIREISASGELLDLFLSDERSDTRRTAYTAGRALFLRGDQGPKLLMFGGMAQVLNRAEGSLSVTRFDQFTYDLGALLTGGAAGKRTSDTLPTRALLAPTDALVAETGQTRAALLYAGHSRLADPFLALATALVGFAALLQGNYSRTGLWWQIGLAVGLLVAVQGVTTLAAARGGKMPMGFLLAYAAPVLGIAISLALLWWASRSRRGPRPVPAAKRGASQGGEPA